MLFSKINLNWFVYISYKISLNSNFTDRGIEKNSMPKQCILPVYKSSFFLEIFSIICKVLDFLRLISIFGSSAPITFMGKRIFPWICRLRGPWCKRKHWWINQFKLVSHFFYLFVLNLSFVVVLSILKLQLFQI